MKSKNNSSAKIILFPQKTSKGFPLKIRITENRKSKYISLKHYLTSSQIEKYWSKKKKELRPAYPHYDIIMNLLNKELKKHGIVIDENEIVVTSTISNKLSFTDFLKNYMYALKVNSQFGLLQKTTSVYNHLIEYRVFKNQPSEIMFDELSIDFLNDLQLYLISEAHLQPITQKGYFEKIRRLINKAIGENKYTPIRHPFLGFEFKKVKTRPKCIEPQQFKLINDSILKNIIRFNIKTKEKLPLLSNEIKNTGRKFLFQYYAYGMRVSDMLQLRWKNIYESGKRMSYTMLKTKSNMDLSLSNELLDILFEFMPYDYRKEIYFKNKRKDGTQKVKIENQIITYNKKTEWYELIRYYLFVMSTDEAMKHLRIFSNIPTDIEGKELYSKTQSQTANYNKDLKDLANELDLTKDLEFPLSSHIARHTFAYLALLSEQSPYYISKALNHKSIKTTEIYLGKFNSRQLDNKFYKKDLSPSAKKEIDDKLKELIASNDYSKKKKIIELFDF